MLASGGANGSQKIKLHSIAGALKTKSYSVTKNSYKNLFPNSVISALQETFPRHLSPQVISQHDKTSRHNISDYDQVLIACSEDPTVGFVFSPETTQISMCWSLDSFHLFTLSKIKQCYRD